MYRREKRCSLKFLIFFHSRSVLSAHFRLREEILEQNLYSLKFILSHGNVADPTKSNPQGEAGTEKELKEKYHFSGSRFSGRFDRIWRRKSTCSSRASDAPTHKCVHVPAICIMDRNFFHLRYFHLIFIRNKCLDIVFSPLWCVGFTRPFFFRSITFASSWKRCKMEKSVDERQERKKNIRRSMAAL